VLLGNHRLASVNGKVFRTSAAAVGDWPSADSWEASQRTPQTTRFLLWRILQTKRSRQSQGER